MTATERLRAMLDERGVEYEDRDMFGKHVFHWGEPLHGAMFTDGGEWTELVVENASPEQAVEATLGRGECRDTGNYVSAFECDTCGEVYEMYRTPSFCPSCGRAVRA